ncbi:MAG: phospho-N-acetylmuramoyl-pentapeptide-transferase, partial [Lachnospiraceae bacterium]|nr:phospho-N-acetylmuramoyl-pentapeptide-transferase [Lachnospiraceae bacterium]
MWVIAFLIAFLVCVLLCPMLIPLLHKLKFGQYIREEGPEAHQKKAGTPTMGGLIFLLAATLVTLIFCIGNVKALVVLLVTLGFGLIGFLDDYIKVVKKRNLGLTALQKMAGLFVITAVFYVYLAYLSDVGCEIIIPFLNGKSINIGWLFIPFYLLAMLGTVNGANLTDGLDGLNASVTSVIAGFFTIVCAVKGESFGFVPAIMLGVLLAYLIFNAYPAKVFMGDTGSLALGGFVAAMAFMLHMPLFIILIAIIYLCEVVSVMMQVSYFKITHGKRIFKMTP